MDRLATARLRKDAGREGGWDTVAKRRNQGEEHGLRGRRPGLQPGVATILLGDLGHVRVAVPP